MENNKKILGFKISTNKTNGLGHLIRCMRIGNEIKKKYKIIFFLDNRLNKNLKAQYSQKPFGPDEVFVLV